METVSQGYFVQRNLIFAGSGESYLIGRVHRDAQGAAKTGYYVWKPDSHPLWRGVSAASFSDPHWTQECDRNRDTFLSNGTIATLSGNCCLPSSTESFLVSNESKQHSCCNTMVSSGT